MYLRTNTSEKENKKKYRLLKKYGPEITWTRIMMDQNNYGPFGIFFFMDLFFQGIRVKIQNSGKNWFFWFSLLGGEN